MLKAVLIDYTGTTVQEGGESLKTAVGLTVAHSDFSSPEEFIAYWWKLVRQYESESYADTFRSEDDILHACFLSLEKTHHLRWDIPELERLTKQWWSCPPLFADTPAFFAGCPYPICMVSNNGAQYVGAGMAHYGLRPAGIVSGEMACAYKPHREIFEKALEISGCTPEEVVHIGDSYNSDIVGAHSAGITKTILVSRRGGEKHDDTIVVGGLDEALREVLKM